MARTLPPGVRPRSGGRTLTNSGGHVFASHARSYDQKQVIEDCMSLANIAGAGPLWLETTGRSLHAWYFS